MGKPRSVGWIAGTVVLVLAIFGATYTLLYMPRKDAAAETLAQAEETQSRNDLLEIQVAQLRKDFARLDDYRAELEEIGTQIPNRANLADLTAMIQAQAVASGVTILEIAPGAPSIVTLAAPTVVTTAPTGGTQGSPGDAAVDQAEETAGDAEDAAEERDDAEPEPAPPPTTPGAVEQIEGFITIPVTVKVVGTYPGVMLFLDQLQMREGRLFLVADMDGVRQKAAEPAQGKPALADGDLELTISGYVYVLLDMPGMVPPDEEPAEEPTDDPTDDPTDEPTDEPTEEPTDEPTLPTSPRNPFIPLPPS